MQWLKERSLTVVLMLLFVGFWVGQVLTGWHEYNQTQQGHQSLPVGLTTYLTTGHMWEATFENWESEFLQMAAFIVLTTTLIQKGSPESRRPGATELVDADPREFIDRPGVPWPVRQGGVVLWLYERSLGLTLGLLFVIALAGHAYGGLSEYAEEQITHGESAPNLGAYITSSRFWFESFQNWQSEFLSIAAMVWLSVYLRQRGSPESKPVHAPHHETGR